VVATTARTSHSTRLRCSSLITRVLCADCSPGPSTYSPARSLGRASGNKTGQAVGFGTSIRNNPDCALPLKASSLGTCLCQCRLVQMWWSTVVLPVLWDHEVLLTVKYSTDALSIDNCSYSLSSNVSWGNFQKQHLRCPDFANSLH
jgi:hypothetical protein